MDLAIFTYFYKDNFLAKSSEAFMFFNNNLALLLIYSLSVCDSISCNTSYGKLDNLEST